MNLYDRIEERQLELHKDLRKQKQCWRCQYETMAKILLLSELKTLIKANPTKEGIKEWLKKSETQSFEAIKNPKTGIGDKYKALAKTVEIQIISNWLKI